MSETNTLTIVEAVETLSNIADIDWNRSMGIAQDHSLLISNELVEYRTVHWLHRRKSKESISLIKEIFRVVLNYLKHFYKSDYSHVTDKKTMEGIKTIMVLVGEAAKKIDKYTNLFHRAHQKSVTELKEYRQLQEFYLRKISRTIDEGVLGKWILALSQKAINERKIKFRSRKSPETQHVFVDLESVKKDSEYELFLIRKEDGSRFFSPRLIRNIKLICDFGDYFNKEKAADPLVDLTIWRDREAQYTAHQIFDEVQGELKDFGQEAYNAEEKGVVSLISKAVFALMLASNGKNLSMNENSKTAAEYFEDFKQFLRDALTSSGYQKLLAYRKERKSEKILKMLHRLCHSLYLSKGSFSALNSWVNYLVEEASSFQTKESHRSKSIWDPIAIRYEAMQKLLKRHASGPLGIILSILEGGTNSYFDPYLQKNLPHVLFYLSDGHNKITHLRIPSPIHQEYIQKADVIPEFKGFLRSLSQDPTKPKHLLINLQDRTSWREQARTQAMEELNDNKEFNQCQVVTVAKDTEFYHQLSPYHEDHQAETFIQHFKEHFDELSGFYFPEAFKKELTASWFDGVIHATHRVFFSKKNVLPREERLDFIEIVYQFLYLKLIEIAKPESFCFSCKDGIDLGCTSSTQLFGFLTVLSENGLSKEHAQLLNLILFAPAIINRERTVLPERFNRMLTCLQTVELAKEEFGEHFHKIILEAFGPYISPKILSLKPYPIKLEKPTH